MANALEQINLLLREKSVLKQDVYHHTVEVFKLLKKTLSDRVHSIQREFGDTDKRVDFHFRDNGDFQAEIKVAGDVLVFYMHTNVFQFEQSHSVWRASYVKEDATRSYVGMIQIYNFLEIGRAHV